MQFLGIVLLSIAAAMGYGVVHDQITARICVEYFTIGHPPVFATEDPTLLGFGWGVIATWWAGLLIGVPLAAAARVGTWPKRSVRTLVRPIAQLLVFMGVCAACAGTVGYVLASTSQVALAGSLARRVPAGQHTGFIVDIWAHGASYLSGFIGGIVLVMRVWRGRRINARRISTWDSARVEDPIHPPG